MGVNPVELVYLTINLGRVDASAFIDRDALEIAGHTGTKPLEINVGKKKVVLLNPVDLPPRFFFYGMDPLKFDVLDA